MKALILAAGFGTRLETGFSEYNGEYLSQVTKCVKDKPKGLVLIKGRPLVSYQLDQIKKVNVALTDVYVHTNNRFYTQYLAWARENRIPEINVFNNGVNTNEERKGMLPDLLSAINQIGYEVPLLVFYSDTLVYDEKGLFNLQPMIDIYRSNEKSSLVIYYKERKASNHGVVTLDEQNNVLTFHEKPVGVESGWVNASVYLFNERKLAEIKDSSSDLLKYQNPLQLLPSQFKGVKASRRFDLGTIEDVLQINGFN